MKKTAANPVDSPREFREHEMFFSTTDRKGVILSGNEVFIRISGYSAAEMVGQPHNIIRHPDMPRAVFRLVWDYLKRGQAVAGYVKNMAADGRYYWVVAMITPLRDGYLSVRFKPTDKLHALIGPLYREMVRIEREAAARGEPGNRGMDLAAEKLLATLRELGFDSYDAFMTALLHAELKSRDAMIARNRGQFLPAELGASSSAGAARLQAIYRQCQETYRLINRLYAELDQYAGLHQELDEGLANVADRVQEFRLLALNATVKSAQLGDLGRCIGVIAARLAELSSDITRTGGGLDERMRPLAVQVRSAILNLAAARLQLEMLMLFVHELATVASGGGVDSRNVADLQTAFDGTIRQAVEELRATETVLRGLGSLSEEFRKLTIIMQVAQISGAVEANRLKDDGSLAQTFQDVRGQAEHFKQKLGGIAEVIASFVRLAGAAPVIVRQITSSVDLSRKDMEEVLVQAAGSKGSVSPPVAPEAEKLTPPTREQGQHVAATAGGHDAEGHDEFFKNT